jgi:hypothetical protein
MLSEFLETQFLKRRGVDLHLDLTDWAGEMGIPYNTLRAMMRSRSKDPRINRRNLAKLIEYFGLSFLEAIGTPVPDKPKNPLSSGGSLKASGVLREQHPDYDQSPLNQLLQTWNSLSESDRAEFLKMVKKGK